MTGSNRLLLGLGWSAVALVALVVASRRSGKPVRELILPERYRLELGFLLVGRGGGVRSSRCPVRSTCSSASACWRSSVGTSCGSPATRTAARSTIWSGRPRGSRHLPAWQRRPLVIAMFVGAALVILASAEPFAEALVGSGAALGVDQFLLVQWLAPLASEAPEFIVAILFAVRGKAAMALGMLISAKVNQWTLLIGSLPVAYLFGGGSTSLVLDARQVEEVLLTATQTLMGVAVLMALRFPRWAALALLGLFAVQFAIPGTEGRLVLSAAYALIGIAPAAAASAADRADAGRPLPAYAVGPGAGRTGPRTRPGRLRSSSARPGSPRRPTSPGSGRGSRRRRCPSARGCGTRQAPSCRRAAGPAARRRGPARP